MATLQELRDRRANAWAQAQEYNERTDDLSAEDEAAWRRALDDIDTVGDLIATRERTDTLTTREAEIDAEQADQRAADAARNGGSLGPEAQRAVDYTEAFLEFCRFGMDSLTVEQRQLLRSGQQDQAQLRAQGISTGAAGGYTVPQGFWNKVTETQLFYANVMNLSESITTDSGNPLPWPTNNGTSIEGELIGENTQANEQDEDFGQAILNAYMYSSKMIRVAYQLLQDSGIDIESFLARRQGERLGRITNRHLTLGTGANQPQGFVTGSTIGVTAASTSVVTYDELIDLEHSVDAAYRMGGNCRWVWNDLMFAKIRKLKDGDQRPLWQPSVHLGTPDTYQGHPYEINNYMASTGANAKTIAFGDFRAGYATRRVTEGMMKRLEERYADYAQVGFIGFSRVDGVVQDTSAIKLLKQAAS